MLQPQERLKLRRSNTRADHQERFYWAGAFSCLGACTVKAAFSAWHTAGPAATPLSAPRRPLIHSEPVVLGRSHLTLEVICFLGLEDLRCIPNIASNAFQPIQVILIHILQERRNDERSQVLTEFMIGHFDNFVSDVGWT